MQNERFAEFFGVFSDVARDGSFSGAARRRGITPSSVARQIDALEAQLDTPLFLRSTRLLTLTDAGQVLLLRARRVLDELDDVQQEIASMKGSISGVLRVACFPTFGKRYVIPVVAALSAQYPGLRIELDLTERLADPVAERLDIVIRIGNLADSTLIATRIATQCRVLCASPAYLAAMGTPACVAELYRHRLLDKLHGADLLGWSDVIGHPLEHGKLQVAFRCDDFDGLRLAALEGLGIGCLPDWVVSADIRAGNLVHVLSRQAEDARMQTGIHLMRVLAEPAAKVRVFIEALRGFVEGAARWD